MPPTQTPQGGSNPVAASDGTQLNPLAVNLAKAIRQTESGGDYNAVGDSGESHGAYQFNKDNFADWASQYGLDPKDTSPVNQDKVAYARINDLLKQGRAPSEVAAIWNGAKLVGGKYEAINPSYVDKVKNNYAKESGLQQAPTAPLASANIGGYQPPTAPGQTAPAPSGNAAGYAPPTPPPAPVQTTTAPTPGSDPSGGFLSGLQEDLSGSNPDSIGTQLENTAKGIGNTLLPSVGDIYNDVTGKNKKTALQQAGDLGTSALTVGSLIPGVDAVAAPLDAARIGEAGAEAATKAAPGMLGSIGKNTTLGAGYGAAGALGQGETDPTKIAQDTAIGAGTGGVIGGIGSLISKAAEALPQRIVRSFLPGINQDTAQYAVKKGLGSPTKMLEDSNASVKSLGSTLGSILNHPQYEGVQANAQDVLPRVIQQFPNAGLTPETVADALMKVAPLQKTLIEKLSSGEGLSLDELHTLNSAVGKNTFKSVFDDPAVKAGKQVGAAFYHSAGDYIKTQAPESTAIFDQLSKEYPLNAALQKAIRSGQKAKTFNLRDLVALIAGFGAKGPIGAGAAFAGERLLTNPGVNLKAAGLLNGLAGPTLNKVAAPATGLATGVLTQENQ